MLFFVFTVVFLVVFLGFVIFLLKALWAASSAHALADTGDNVVDDMEEDWEDEDEGEDEDEDGEGGESRGEGNKGETKTTTTTTKTTKKKKVKRAKAKAKPPPPALGGLALKGMSKGMGDVRGLTGRTRGTSVHASTLTTLGSLNFELNAQMDGLCDLRYVK